MCTQLSIEAIMTVLWISSLASLNDSYKDTMTERGKYDCTPHKRICSSIVVASLRWLFIIMLHERNGLFCKDMLGNQASLFNDVLELSVH